jgi:hypothetical protein
MLSLAKNPPDDAVDLHASPAGFRWSGHVCLVLVFAQAEGAAPWMTATFMPY